MVQLYDTGGYDGSQPAGVASDEFLDASELAALRELADPYFTTPIEIYRPGTGPVDVAAPGYDPTQDYGDDEITFPDAEPGATPVAATTGWFFSTIQTAVDNSSGQVATIDLHQLRLKLGTNIRSQDIVKRLDSGETYVVVDTNAEDTWPDMLRAALRRRE